MSVRRRALLVVFYIGIAIAMFVFSATAGDHTTPLAPSRTVVYPQP